VRERAFHPVEVVRLGVHLDLAGLLDLLLRGTHRLREGGEGLLHVLLQRRQGWERRRVLGVAARLDRLGGGVAVVRATRGRPPGGGVVHLRGGRGGKLGGRGRGARGEEGAVGSRTSMGAGCSSGSSNDSPRPRETSHGTNLSYGSGSPNSQLASLSYWSSTCWSSSTSTMSSRTRSRIHSR